MIGNKVADKIISVSKKTCNELHSKELTNNNGGVEISFPKKRYISPKERQQSVAELRLVPEKDAYF